MPCIFRRLSYSAWVFGGVGNKPVHSCAEAVSLMLG